MDKRGDMLHPGLLSASLQLRAREICRTLPAPFRCTESSLSGLHTRHYLQKKLNKILILMILTLNKKQLQKGAKDDRDVQPGVAKLI